MIKIILPARACALAALLFTSSIARGQVVLPPVNLGGTSFMDGVAGPGVLLEPGVIEHYRANRFVNSKGEVIAGRNSLDTWANLVHVGYISTQKWLGAFVGAEFLVPVASVDINTDFGPRGQQSGVGDLVVSPLILQWPARLLGGKTFFSRFSVLAELPTGSYSDSKPVNIGSNAGGVFAYYAFTLFPTRKLETSWRVNYRWNAKNHSPFVPLAVPSTQAGQAVHVNYAMSYAASPSFRIGANGYLVQQMTDHYLGDKPLIDSRERVVALGPGGAWSSGFWSVIANVDWEMLARNRPEGYRVNVTARRIFPRMGPGGGPH